MQCFISQVYKWLMLCKQLFHLLSFPLLIFFSFIDSSPHYFCKSAYLLALFIQLGNYIFPQNHSLSEVSLAAKLDKARGSRNYLIQRPPNFKYFAILKFCMCVCTCIHTSYPSTRQEVIKSFLLRCRIAISHTWGYLHSPNRKHRALQ